MSVHRLIRSSSLLAAEGLLQRLAGLISTLVLARLLMPEDFGLVTMALLVIWFSQTFTQTGVKFYLLSIQTIDSEDINSAFTLNMLFRGSVYILIALFASYVADLYDAPDIAEVLIVLCVINLITCFDNPSLVLLQRQNKYEKVVAMSIIVKVLRVVITIIAAFQLRNHWALVVGHAAGSLCNLIGSYLIFPYLPKLSLSRVKKQFSFSIWILMQSLVGYCRDQLDVLFTGFYFGKAELGAYNNIKFIGNIPLLNLIIPMTSPVINNFRDRIEDKESMRLRVDASLLVLSFVVLPLFLTLGILHEEIILLVLGPNWTQYSASLVAFSSMFFFRAYVGLLTNLVMIHNEVKRLFTYDLISLMIFAIAFFLIREESFVVFLMTVAVVENLLRFVFFIYLYSRYIGFSIKGVLKPLVSVVFAVIGFVIYRPIAPEWNTFMFILVNGLVILFGSLSISALILLLFKKEPDVKYIVNLSKNILSKKS